MWKISTTPSEKKKMKKILFYLKFMSCGHVQVQMMIERELHKENQKYEGQKDHFLQLLFFFSFFFFLFFCLFCVTRFFVSYGSRMTGEVFSEWAFGYSTTLAWTQLVLQKYNDNLYSISLMSHTYIEEYIENIAHNFRVKLLSGKMSKYRVVFFHLFFLSSF